MSSDRTQFAYARNKTVAMPRVMKRSLQVAIAAGLTALAVLVVMVVNGFPCRPGREPFGSRSVASLHSPWRYRLDDRAYSTRDGRIPLLAARSRAPLRRSFRDFDIEGPSRHFTGGEAGLDRKGVPALLALARGVINARSIALVPMQVPLAEASMDVNCPGFRDTEPFFG